MASAASRTGYGAIGKVVGDKCYLHVDCLPKLAQTPEARHLLVRLAQAETLASLRRGEQFNLVRVDISGNALALLHYPEFSEDPFPALAASWLVDLETGSLGYRTYADSLNPLILHLK